MARRVRPKMAPTTMPAMAPPERLLLEDEGVADGEVLEVAVAEAAVFCDGRGLNECSAVVEATLLLSGAPEIVEIAPRYEDIEPICVREAEGAGVLSSLRVSSFAGLGA